MAESEGDRLTGIGRIVKPDGADGRVLLSLRNLSPDDIDLKEPMFIFSDGLRVPFFIESIVARGDGKALIRFIGVNSLTDAEELAGTDVYMRADMYDFIEESNGFPDLSGWTLFSENGEKIGCISDYEDIPGNPCIYVETMKGQVMIPVREELIKSADVENKSIVMTVPEGLF